MIKISAFIIAFLISISSISHTEINFYKQNFIEKKIGCDVSIHDDFVDNSVLVILTEKASNDSKIYDKFDFQNVRCKNVEELTPPKEKIVLKHGNSYNRILNLKLETNSKEYVLEVINKLKNREDIFYVGPNIKLSLCSTVPNDYIPALQWAIDSIHLPQVWDFSTGSSSIKVGIIDTGIDANHEDLQSNISPCGVNSLHRDFSTGNEVFVDTPTDPHGHGTEVAGIIGAVGNNDIPMTGINWNTSLVSLNIMDDEGEIAISNAINAIAYATTAGIEILNFSAGYNENRNSYNVPLKEAIENYSGLFISAAGNNGENNDGDYNIHFPASHNLSNLISVGAIDDTNNRWSSSNYGENSVNIYAPGVDVFTTYTTIKWSNEVVSGTSFATPHVAGVAALLLSINPDLTPTQLKAAILNSAPTITISTPDGNQNVKKLDAFEALKYVFSNYSSSSYLSYNETISSYINGNSSYFCDKNSFRKLNVTDFKEFDFTITANDPIDVTLYDNNFNIIDLSGVIITTESGCKKEFTYNLNNSVYYLRVKYVDALDTGTVNIQIEDPAHVHNYSSWQYYDITNHISVCACGQTGPLIKKHIIRIEDYGNAYGMCMMCGHIIPSNALTVNSMSITQFSLNGSFILPNGIIVLVDEDIEAYLNGTLVFYNKDELPEVA